MSPLTAADLYAASGRLLEQQGRTPWNLAAPAPFMDTAERFYQLINASCPGATITASVEHHGGGSTPRTMLCEARITAPNISGHLLLHGATPDLATAGLRKRWATARREFDSDRVVGECVRLSERLMTDTQQATLREKLLTCPHLEFDSLAAKARKQAQSLVGEGAYSQEYWAERPAA